MEQIKTKTILCGLILFTIAPHGLAERKLDHEQARELRLNGKILPLAEILQKAEAHNLYQILELELEKKNGRWLYEVEGLSGDKHVVELYFDAETGELLSTEKHKLKHKD